MDGSACTIRRSPHSMAAEEPAAIVTQRSRRSVAPGFTPTTETRGAGTLTTVTATVAESPGVLSNALTIVVPVPAAPTLYVSVAMRLSPGETFDNVVGVTWHPDAVPVQAYPSVKVATTPCRFLTKNRWEPLVDEKCCRSGSSARTATPLASRVTKKVFVGQCPTLSQMPASIWLLPILSAALLEVDVAFTTQSGGPLFAT